MAGGGKGSGLLQQQYGRYALIGNQKRQHRCKLFTLVLLFSKQIYAT
jgi:hypothetical protein